MEQLSNKNRRDLFLRAKARVKALKGFYLNVLLYCLVIPFIIFINYKTSWKVKWFWFSAIGWGIGIAFHAYRVYAKKPIFGERWERRKIEQFIEEESNTTWH
ncbi:hypothetical protein MHTCC0001_25690 [Flavobacteriaceae bacterium MHTCC 0001]